MSIINSKDFNRLHLKVHDLPMETDLLAHFSDEVSEDLPAFLDYAEKSKRDDVNHVIRYIVYMFDKNSPMVHYFNDINRRMTECAKLAGFKAMDDTSKLYDLTFGQYAEIEGWETPDGGDDPEPVYGPPIYPMADMVTDYCCVTQPNKWTMVMTRQHLFREYTRDLLLPITHFKDQKQKLDALMVKAKLREEQEKIEGTLDSLYGEIFGEAFEAIEVAKVRATTPERRNRKGKIVTS
jgi:hypothetical protein